MGRQLKKRSGSTALELFFKYSLYIESVLIFLLFGILTGGTFISTRNLSNLMMQGATCSIIAVTMMLVIVSCNADLSAGLVLGCLGTLAASIQVTYSLSTGLSLIVMLLCCLLIGAWHGFWIGYKKLPAFIVTLATQLVAKGVTLLIGGGIAIGPINESFAWIGKSYLPNILDIESFNVLSAIITTVLLIVYLVLMIRGECKKIKMGLIKPRWGKKIATLCGFCAASLVISAIFIFYKGFPYAILLLIAITGIYHFVVNNTSFGRHVFAIGGNVEAARLCGINVEKTIFIIYILHSIQVGLAAIVYLGRVGQATATAGTSFEFTAITGCVVGGTSIAGGRGNVLGAVVGTMLMAALDNGMSLLNMGQDIQYIVKGLVLMFAIAMDVISRTRKS